MSRLPSDASMPTTSRYTSFVVSRSAEAALPFESGIRSSNSLTWISSPSAAKRAMFFAIGSTDRSRSDRWCMWNATPSIGTPSAGFASYIRNEMAKAEKIIADASIKAE